jgi:hypothetical protein
METAIKEKEKTIVTEEKKGKRKWLIGIANFLMYGGWILVGAIIIGILVLISYLSK